MKKLELNQMVNVNGAWSTRRCGRVRRRADRQAGRGNKVKAQVLDQLADDHGCAKFD